MSLTIIATNQRPNNDISIISGFEIQTKNSSNAYSFENETFVILVGLIFPLGYKFKSKF